MAVDKLVDSSQLNTDLTSVANAIRAKSGGVAALVFPAGFVSEIQAIPSGGGGVSLDDWLADNVAVVSFSGSTIPTFAFAGHKGPSGNGGIEFNLPNITNLPQSAFISAKIKSFSAPLVNSVATGVFSNVVFPTPQESQGVVVALPALETIPVAVGFSGFGGSLSEMCPILFSLPLLRGRTAQSSNYQILFGYSANYYSGLYPYGITEITQDPQKNVLPASGIRVYIPLLTRLERQDCSYIGSLVRAELPNVVYVGQYALAGCTALTYVDLSSVTELAGSALYQDTALASLSLPLCTTLGDSALSGCTALTSISLPVATSIGASCFSGCTSLASATLSVATVIPSNCFSGCTVLSSIVMPHVTEIASSAFYNCRLTSIDLSSITTLGYGAFNACRDLTSVTLGNNITAIQMQTFQNCTALTSIDLNKVTSVAYNAFYGCTSLASVTIRKSTSLANCFSGCSSLTALIIDLDDPTGTLPSLTVTARTVFNNTPITAGTGYVYINDDRVSDLKAMTNWAAIASQIKPLSELPTA